MEEYEKEQMLYNSIHNTIDHGKWFNLFSGYWSIRLYS